MPRGHGAGLGHGSTFDVDDQLALRTTPTALAAAATDDQRGSRQASGPVPEPTRPEPSRSSRALPAPRHVLAQTKSSSCGRRQMVAEAAAEPSAAAKTCRACRSA